MRLSSTTLFFGLYLFYQSFVGVETSQFGYEMRGLAETDISLFKDEIYGWEILNSKSLDVKSRTKIENITQPKLVLLMDNTTQTFIVKAMFYVPFPHKYIVGSFRLWYYEDDFTDGSAVKLEVFITSIYPQTMEELQKPCFMMNIPRPEKQVQPHFEHIYFGESHNSSDLWINVKVSINSHESYLAKPKSLALRDVRLHLSNESQDATYPLVECPLNKDLNENLICQYCAENCETCFGPKPSQCLSCSAGNHWHGLGCTSCHGFCDDCTGPTQHECLGCNFPFYDYGNGTCLDTCCWPFYTVGARCVKACKSDEYAFRYNGTCIPSCPVPFVASIDNNGILICQSPCSHHDDFLYTNGSCIAVCPTPFVIEYVNSWLSLCKNPCEAGSAYFYANQSCLKQCLSPLKIKTDSMGKYCVNPCESEKLYLYSNGSCLSTCKAPLVEVLESGVRYCKNPCRIQSDYLYFNQSCFKECPAPLQVVIAESIANFCVNPCHSESLFLYNNGSCLSTCPAPLEESFDQGVRRCRNPCRLSSEYLYYNRSCFKECPFPLQIKSESIANFCMNPCPSENLFLYQNRSCLPGCKSPLVAVFDDGVKYCRNPCRSASDYLYSNRSCLKECPAPLQVRSDSMVNYCVNPCARLNLYLFSNGSCLSICLFPLRIREESGVKYCEPPCRLTEEYILKDGSCSEKCPAPLVRRAVTSVGTFCLSPCKSNDYFIVRNESCVLDCPVYFATKIEHGVKFCIQPCSPEQYYFPQNRSCFEMCPHPFKVTSEGEIKVCKSSCSNANDFIYDDQSCHESCPIPLIIEERFYCKSPCLKENEYVDINGDCQETCQSPDKILQKGPYKMCLIGPKKAQPAQIVAIREIIKVSKTLVELGGVLNCIIHPGDPTSLFMVPLLDMFQKIIYTEVPLPSKTEFVLNQRILSSELTVEVRVQKTLQLRKTFDERFAILAIVYLVALLVSVLLKLTRSLNESKVYQLDVALRWNTLVPLFISVSGDILLPSLIEFQLNSLTDILWILLITLVFSQVYRVSSQRRREADLLPRWRFLFETFSESQRFFTLSYFARLIVYHLVLGFLPQFQAFLLMVMSCGMCFYLIWVSPIAKRICKIQYLVAEFALLLYNLLFCALAAFDLSSDDFLLVDICGQLMNIVYLITSVITAIIIVLKIIHGVYSLYTTSRNSHSQTEHIQLSEMNLASDPDSPAESARFEPLSQEEEEGNSEDQNNFDLEEDCIEPSIAIE